MKKYALLFLISLLSTGIFAQLRLGLRGGLSTTQIKAEQLNIFNDGGIQELGIAIENANYGLHGGIFVQAVIGSFFIQPEALFNSSTVDYRVQDFRSGNLDEQILREEYRYLDIPIMMGFKFGPLRLQGGAVGHLYLGNDTQLSRLEGYSQDFDELSYGWQTGIGIDIWRFLIDVRYEGNFNRFGDHIVIDGENYDFRDQPARIIASIGFSFFE